MKTGKILDHKNKGANTLRNGEFTISFDQSEFGPYNFIFDRERLYFDENLNERGSFFFPLKEQLFNNTEIFIERNDIVIALGERGSFSGSSRVFMEVVNITHKKKYRFYPEEVSLIYNSKENIVIYYKKGKAYKKLELDIGSLEKVSEISQHVSAFFKLYYNHTNQSYGRLVYKVNSNSHTAGYFVEETIISDISKPAYFHREKFIITCDGYSEKSIDVWEASLTGEL